MWTKANEVLNLKDGFYWWRKDVDDAEPEIIKVGVSGNAPICVVWFNGDRYGFENLPGELWSEAVPVPGRPGFDHMQDWCNGDLRREYINYQNERTCDWNEQKKDELNKIVRELNRRGIKRVNGEFV